MEDRHRPHATEQRNGDSQGAPQALSAAQIAHQRRMSILANAPKQDLLKAWQSLGLDPGCELLRGPETGLVALRGRIGGGGAPFNFGEATATRATVRMENGAIGHAIMLGRDAGKAKLAAVIDAMANDSATAELIESRILTPLEQAAVERNRQQVAETQATRVNFFTMVRGDD